MCSARFSRLAVSGKKPPTPQNLAAHFSKVPPTRKNLAAKIATNSKKFSGIGQSEGKLEEIRIYKICNLENN